MNSEEELCVVCCREITLYATGPCDHHVCYECSTRMRVLCEQNECPICRSDMPDVIFTHQKRPFSSVQKFDLVSKKYTIAFEDKLVEDAFKKLLQHRCQECGDIFETFEDLKTHVQRSHSLFFCELCVQNLKIFTFERKCYSRKELALHKRKGDPDNTSHRGHPLCQFCDKRFVDLDELYRHLRREHYYCHFCDADGVQDGQFYKDYSYLKVHFRKKHFLCEEGDCAQDKFVVAFRTEIDYKAHKALNHTKNKTKAEVKQARILDLEFPILPRSSSNGDSSPNHSDYRHNRHSQQNSYERKKNVDDHMSRDVPNESRSSRQIQSKTFNTQCAQEFPSLVNGTLPKGNEYFPESNRYSSRISNDCNQQPVRQERTAMGKQAQVEDFPALSAPVNQRSLSNINKSTAYGHSQNTSSNNASHLKKWSRPPSFQENNNSSNKNEKVKAQSSTWRPPKKPLSNLEEEFPKLQTKMRQSNISPMEEVSQGEWDRPDTRPVVAASSSLAQQIYQKCKSKKKQKYIVEATEEEELEEPKKHASRDQPLALTKMYGGISNSSVLENEENKDPLSSLNMKINDKIERFRIANQDDDVPWRETVHLVEDDFPPLGPPVATSRCPPGFNSVISATDVSSVPPGFKEKATCAYPPLNSTISLSSIAQQLSADNEAVSSEKATNHSYQPPYDFQKRNILLIQQIHEFVNSDNKLFDEFRSLSGMFRKDKISAAEYHFNCMRILGKEKFLQLFPELLCLLPDINKQQELLTVHNTFQKQDSKKKGAVPKHKGTKVPSSLLTVCQACQQVLVKSDFGSHMEHHKNVSNM